MKRDAARGDFHLIYLESFVIPLWDTLAWQSKAKRIISVGNRLMSHKFHISLFFHGALAFKRNIRNDIATNIKFSIFIPSA